MVQKETSFWRQVRVWSLQKGPRDSTGLPLSRELADLSPPAAALACLTMLSHLLVWKSLTNRCPANSIEAQLVVASGEQLAEIPEHNSAGCHWTAADPSVGTAFFGGKENNAMEIACMYMYTWIPNEGWSQGKDNRLWWILIQTPEGNYVKLGGECLRPKWNLWFIGHWPGSVKWRQRGNSKLLKDA